VAQGLVQLVLNNVQAIGGQLLPRQGSRLSRRNSIMSQAWRVRTYWGHQVSTII